MHEYRRTMRISGPARRTQGRHVMTLEETDARLVREIRLGDRDALGRLYDRHAVSLERHARTWCNPSDAQDVVHDTFVALVARADQYDPSRGEVVAWLHRS